MSINTCPLYSRVWNLSVANTNSSFSKAQLLKHQDPLVQHTVLGFLTLHADHLTATYNS